jgi:hypothetical protein
VMDPDFHGVVFLVKLEVVVNQSIEDLVVFLIK